MKNKLLDILSELFKLWLQRTRILLVHGIDLLKLWLHRTRILLVHGIDLLKLWLHRTRILLVHGIDLFKLWLHRTRILRVHGIDARAHTDGQIFDRLLISAVLSIMIFLQLVLGFVLMIISNNVL